MQALAIHHDPSAQAAVMSSVPAKRPAWYSLEEVFDVTPLGEADILRADQLEDAIAEAPEPVELDFEAMSEAILDRLGDALLDMDFDAIGAEVAAAAEAPAADAEVDDSYMTTRPWQLLYEGVVRQPVLVTDPASMFVAGARRREVHIEFSAVGARLYENAAGSTAEHFLVSDIACGLPALLPTLVSYLKFALFDAGLDRREVGECFSQSLLRNLLETGIARVGLADIPVPGIGTVMATYYSELVRKVMSRSCAGLDQYDAVTLAAPDWLLPFVGAARHNHPSIRIERLA